jgi:inosine-uridine nucleoside N-ribohydrolase
MTITAAGEQSFGYCRSPCHDALAAAVLTGEVQPLVFPVIDIQVDRTDGPGRGATICDTRSQYRKWDPPPRGNCRVAHVTDGTYPDKLVDALTASAGRGAS